MSGYGISFMKMKKKLEERQALSWVDVEGRWVIIVSESRNPFLVEHVSWYWLNEHAKEILLQGRESLVARLVAEEREREERGKMPDEIFKRMIKTSNCRPICIYWTLPLCSCLWKCIASITPEQHLQIFFLMHILFIIFHEYNPISAQLRLPVLSGSAVFYIYNYVKLF